MNNDLISREALLKDARRLLEGQVTDGHVYYLHVNAVEVAAIKAAPAVDAEPVRHGRWIDDMYFDEPVTRCTSCKHGFAKGHNAECFSYCPNCGAKMDLEAQKDD